MTSLLASLSRPLRSIPTSTVTGAVASSFICSSRHPLFLSFTIKSPSAHCTWTQLTCPLKSNAQATHHAAAILKERMSSPAVKEHLPAPLNSSAQQPPLFDGTTRLYTCYTCPFAQRVWITRNCKGSQDKIELVPLNLQDRPAWYKEKVYPVNKVPALEHNGKIIGESLYLIKYVDSNFEGPSLVPSDPAKKRFSEVLIAYTDEFTGTVFTSFKSDPIKEAAPAFNYLENALHKFEDGPFFLGQFSLVDIAFIPFVERFQIFLYEQFKYDITAGRPKLAAWIEEMNKIEAYTQTKTDPTELVEFYKKRFMVVL